MQKKLIALAVAGLASSGAFAQSNVTIYGTLRPSYDFVTVKSPAGAKTGDLSSMNSNTSILGFKGEEDLGNGLKTIFGLEYNIDPVNENTSIGGKNATGQSNLLGGGTQDMFVGFAGNSWGSLKFGSLNNAEKNVFAHYDNFSFSIGDYNNIFSQGVDSRNSQAAYYQSPSWSGFTLHASYALDGTKNSASTPEVDKTKSSLGGEYVWGGLAVTAGFSQGNVVGGDDQKSQRYGAMYTFSSKTQLLGVYGIDKNFNGHKDQAQWMIGVAQPVSGNVTLMADYIAAQDDKDTAGDQKADNYNLGVKYAFSKRTNVQALYTYLKNDGGATGGTATFDSGYTVAAGGKADAFSLRLQHAF